MRKIVLLTVVLIFCQVNSQTTTENLSFQLGPLYNHSPGSDEFNSATAIGLFIQSDYKLTNRMQLGLRFEPTALVWGVLELPGGCDGVCREGANYLLNYYLKADYFVGNTNKHKTYLGLNLLLQTHKRYIITSRVPGNFMDTRRRVSGLGFGLRCGILLGRFDLSAAYNIAEEDFQDYFNFSLGYVIWRK